MAIASYTFDQVARAERYFADTLLPHLLFSREFMGLKLLFQHVLPSVDFSQMPEVFEVVTELDPLRDGSVGNDAIRKLYRDLGRVAVPDVFVRWERYCLVIEAKFFTDPADDDLAEQISLQRKAIATIRNHTQYHDQSYQFEHVILGIRPCQIQLVHSIIWDELCDVILAPVLALPDADIQYCQRVIRHAIARAKQDAVGKMNFTKMKYDELMKNLPVLIQQEKVYIGFLGGERQLASATLDELENRSHYKVSNESRNENWITLDRFLHRVFQLKGYCQ